VDLERAISEVTERIARGVGIITGAERKANALRRDYDLARALAYTAAEGSIKDKEAQSVIETMESRRLAEDAEAEYRHAQRTAAALEKQLSGLQAQAKLVGSMYGAVRA
jgi:ribosomal protein L9